MFQVCMIVQKDYPSDSRVRRYAEALAAAGAHVDVLCLPDAGGAAQRNSAISLHTIPLRRETESLAGHILEYAAGMTLFVLRLMPLYLKNRHRIVHVHNMPDFLIFTALIPRLMGAKIILDIHDPMPEFYQTKYRDRANLSVVRLMQIEERVSCMFAHAIITANPNFKENLVRRGIPERKITVVNNLPDPKIFNRAQYERESRRDKTHFTLIYPGTIAPRYGLDVAIRALPFLKSRIPQVRLLIIGPEVEYAKTLHRLVEQLGVSDLVEFKPNVPVQEVPLHLIQSDIGIYTALPDPHMEIAMPVKVMEYAAMGVPIVASRLKVLQDAFPDSSMMFFEPGNVDQFAHCVLKLCEDPRRRLDLVQNADRLFVRTHSWENERQTYFDLLNRLVEPGAEFLTSQTRDGNSPEKAT